MMRTKLFDNTKIRTSAYPCSVELKSYTDNGETKYSISVTEHYPNVDQIQRGHDEVYDLYNFARVCEKLGINDEKHLGSIITNEHKKLLTFNDVTRTFHSIVFEGGMRITDNTKCLDVTKIKSIEDVAFVLGLMDLRINNEICNSIPDHYKKLFKD